MKLVGRSIFKRQQSIRERHQTRKKNAEESCRKNTKVYEGVGGFESPGFTSFSSTYIEKKWSSSSVYLQWWWSTQDIWPAWRIHKYRLIGKRNPNGQFPRRNRVEFVPSVGKKFSTMTDFELRVRRWFWSARLKEWGCQILRKVVGHRSRSNVFSTSQFGFAELNEFGLQKKLFWSYVEPLPHSTHVCIPLVRNWSGMKRRSIALFFHISDFHWKQRKGIWIKWMHLSIVILQHRWLQLEHFFLWPVVLNVQKSVLHTYENDGVN